MISKNNLSKVKGDISKSQDLIMATVNLISLEEHLAFTAAKIGESDFYDMAKAVRKIRVKCLRELIGEPPGELWCASKHALSAMMRLLEVASKEEGEKCDSYVTSAFDLYQLFWLMKEIGSGKDKGKVGKHGTESSESEGKA